MVGRHARTRSGVVGAVLRLPATRREEADSRARAHALLQRVGIAQHANRLAKNLPYGDQRRLEIARALATEPTLLALDEPAAGMNKAERVALRELLLQLQADGLTLLLIEHDVKLVMGLCDPAGGAGLRREDRRGHARRGQPRPQGDRRLPRGRGAMSALLAVHQLVGRLRRHPGGARAQPGGGAGRNGLPHRRQRRRQDHHAQGPQRPAAAARRQRAFRRPVDHPASRRTKSRGAGWHWCPKDVACSRA